MNKIRYLGLGFLWLLLASCGNTSPAEDTGKSAVAQSGAQAAGSAEKAEDGVATQSAPSEEMPSGGRFAKSEAEDVVKAFINLQGELCAEIVSARPLSLPNTMEVTCIEYRGGSARVTYVVNTATGDLEKAG